MLIDKHVVWTSWSVFPNTTWKLLCIANYKHSLFWNHCLVISQDHACVLTNSTSCLVIGDWIHCSYRICMSTWPFLKQRIDFIVVFWEILWIVWKLWNSVWAGHSLFERIWPCYVCQRHLYVIYYLPATWCGSVLNHTTITCINDTIANEKSNVPYTCWHHDEIYASGETNESRGDDRTVVQTQMFSI